MLADALTGQGQAVVAAIREGQTKKGLSASGRTAATLRAEVVSSRDRLRLQIYGSRVFRYLQNGRGPNRSGKPGREQIDGLTEWVKLRGLPLAAVWPIAINQAKRGITVPNAHNPGGVLSDPISPANLHRRLLPALRTVATEDIHAQLFPRS